MNQKRIKHIFVPIITIIGLLFTVAWMAGVFNQKVQPSFILSTPQLATDSYVVSLKPVDLYESVSAGLKAREATIISSRILARIEKIHVRAGDNVLRGQLLVTMENNGLKAKVLQAKANTKSVEALTEEAELNLDRIKKLRLKKLVSVSELDKASAQYNRLRSDLEASKQNMNEANTALNYSLIEAPINGRIVDRSAEPGNIATPGQTLLSLYNPSSLQVIASAREALAVGLSIGQDIEVQLDSVDLKLQAVISEIVPAADPNSRSFIIKADLKYDTRLLPGMFARIQIKTGVENQIIIPNRYIYQFGQLNMVWVKTEQQLLRRFIRKGLEGEKQTQIISGLEDDEVIVLRN